MRFSQYLPPLEEVQTSADRHTVAKVLEAVLFVRVHIKMIVLPRQARDKPRKNSNKVLFFF